MIVRTIKFRTGIAALALLSVSLLAAGTAQASLQLQSSVIVVDAGEGEGVISLKNKSESPVLLHSAVVDIAEDSEPLLLVTPPITRVDPGDTQMVRFILKNEGAGRPVERLRRATFEGIPQAAPGVVSIAVRQNIPVIIRPKGLKPNSTPWTLLQWQRTDTGLSVTNTGAYVVRMAPELSLANGGASLSLPRTYILPGETLTVPAATPLAATEQISFRPASLNGYLLEPVQAALAAPDAAKAALAAP